ncbi:unnamed protein product, partial [Bubo scandiacus]
LSGKAIIPLLQHDKPEGGETGKATAVCRKTVRTSLKKCMSTDEPLTSIYQL